MNQLKVFEHTQFGELEIVTMEGKEFFPATDVARKLGYADPYSAIRQHTRKGGWVNHPVIDSLGRTQQKRFISEGNLYRLITNSKLPDAERFESWVFDEILPSIRKDGGYIATNEDDDEESIMAKAVLIANKTIDKKNRQLAEQKQVIEQQRPKVLFAESVEASQTSILVRELAVILKQNGIDIGERRLFEWLRSNGFLVKRFGSDRNTPTQRSMNMGLFEVKETPINHNSGLISISKTTKVTGRGQVYFINKFLKQKKSEDVANA